MSKEYDNNMRGVLFHNDRKESDRHPDLKGSCEVDGVEYWLSAWRKEGANGKFLSLAFTKKEARVATRSTGKVTETAEKKGEDPFDDDNPPF